MVLAARAGRLRSGATGSPRASTSAVGIATIPLLLVKLWSIYPNLFRWPPVRSVKHAIERLSVAVLVSTALVQVTTGFLNVLNWYPFPWYFTTVHRFLGYVVVGSVLLHVGGQAARHRLRAAGQGRRRRRADRDPVGRESGLAQQRRRPARPGHAGDLPARRARRAGAGVGVVVVTSVGQTVTPLEPLGLLAVAPVDQAVPRACR